MTGDDKPESKAEPRAEAKPPAEQRWQLALAYLAQGDRAANALRIVLFLAASALFLLAFSALRPGLKGLPLWAPGASMLFCLVAIGSVVKGLRLQAGQAAERYRLLRAGNEEGIAQYDAVIEQLRGRQSGFWDRIALWSLVLAFAIQALAKVLTTAVVLHV